MCTCVSISFRGISHSEWLGRFIWTRRRFFLLSESCSRTQRHSGDVDTLNFLVFKLKCFFFFFPSAVSPLEKQPSLNTAGFYDTTVWTRHIGLICLHSANTVCASRTTQYYIKKKEKEIHTGCAHVCNQKHIWKSGSLWTQRGVTFVWRCYVSMCQLKTLWQIQRSNIK